MGRCDLREAVDLRRAREPPPARAVDEVLEAAAPRIAWLQRVGGNRQAYELIVIVDATPPVTSRWLFPHR
jgi:hypothetical protein